MQLLAIQSFKKFWSWDLEPPLSFENLNFFDAMIVASIDREWY